MEPVSTLNQMIIIAGVSLATIGLLIYIFKTEKQLRQAKH
jgi:hypothetical protein